MNRIMSWFNGKASIRKKLIISFGIMVSVPVLVLGFYIFYKTKSNLESQTESVMENNLSRLMSEMSTRIDREEDNSKYLAYNLEFRKALKEAAGDTIGLASTMNRYVEPVFWYFITSDQDLKGINIYTPLVEKDMGSFLKTEETVEEEAWYQEHQKNFGTTWEYEDERIYATRSILDPETTSTVIAVMRLEFFPGSFLEPLSSMDYLDNGVVLLDDNEKLVYGRLPGKESEWQELRKDFVDGKSESGRYLLKTHTMENDWKLYYFVSRSSVSGQLHEIWAAAFLVMAACILVIIFLITIFSRHLSWRILQLRDRAEEVASGNFDSPQYTTDTDEIGVVTNSFAEMTRRLNEMVHQVYIMKIEKQAMELTTLRAMINPHFLYNSLSSVKWKAIREGNDEISTLIGYLARFYRTCLNNGQDLTTVRNELENIRNYVEIQKMTHEDNFDCIFIVDEEGMEKEMLNFILQPIVENAIKHGIDYREDQEEKGMVVVEFRQEDGYLVFRVFNNGPSVTEEQLERSLNQPGKGYGMYNIRQRLSLYYKEEGSVSACTIPWGGVCFTVKMPDKVTGESKK